MASTDEPGTQQTRLKAELALLASTFPEAGKTSKAGSCRGFLSRAGFPLFLLSCFRSSEGKDSKTQPFKITPHKTGESCYGRGQGTETWQTHPNVTGGTAGFYIILFALSCFSIVSKHFTVIFVPFIIRKKTSFQGTQLLYKKRLKYLSSTKTIFNIKCNSSAGKT